METYNRDVVHNLNVIDEVKEQNQKMRKGAASEGSKQAGFIAGEYMREVARVGTVDKRTGEIGVSDAKSRQILDNITKYHGR